MVSCEPTCWDGSGCALAVHIFVHALFPVHIFMHAPVSRAQCHPALALMCTAVACRQCVGVAVLVSALSGRWLQPCHEGRPSHARGLFLGARLRCLCVCVSVCLSVCLCVYGLWGWVLHPLAMECTCTCNGADQLTVGKHVEMHCRENGQELGQWHCTSRVVIKR